jgi:hypothetical protein
MARGSTETDANSPDRPDESRVRADVRLLVARDAPRDLVDGVRALLGRVDAVAAVEDIHVTGMRPSLNDLRVDATVTLTIVGRPDDPAAALTDGFGVDRAAVVDTLCP